MSSGPFAAAIADAAPSVFIFLASCAKSRMEKFSGISNWPSALPAAHDLNASNMPSVRDLMVVNRRVVAGPISTLGWTQTSVDGRLHSPPLSAVGPQLGTVPVHVRGCARVRRRALLEHTRVSISTRPDPRFDASTSTRGHPGKCCDAVGLFSSALFVKSAEIWLPQSPAVRTVSGSISP